MRRWKWESGGNLKCSSGASLEKWQVESLLAGASEASFRRDISSKWSEDEVESFIKFINKKGGFEYK
mgnify:CR=1 FL=1